MEGGNGYVSLLSADVRVEHIPLYQSPWEPYPPHSGSSVGRDGGAYHLEEKGGAMRGQQQDLGDATTTRMLHFQDSY